MSQTVLPASPNWYCSKVADGSNSGFFLYGARHDVYCFDCQNFPPKFRGAFLGHREKVTALCLGTNNDGDFLCCSSSEDGVVCLWNVETREVLSQHNLHSNKVTGLSWSPVQSDLIITGDDRGVIGVWQFTDNRQNSFSPEKGSVYALSASPSSAAVVAVGYRSGTILLLDVKRNGYILQKLRGHDEEIHSLVWCPIPGEEFKPAPAGPGAGKQDITDLETFGVDDSWRRKPAPSLEPVEGFGSEGWLLASGSKDKSVRIWSTTKGRQLLLMKLPNMGRKERTDDSGKARLWLTLYWPKDSPTELLSSSQSGDLLVWDITKSGRDKSRLFHPSGQGHTRFVFNICCMGPEGEVLVTTSMDRQIMFWNLKLKMMIGILPTLGGYCYTVKTSPIDPGRLALGVGDNMIRLWNLNAPPDMFDIVSLWQGIRGKVTALSWHPKKEGLLAYGTDDGRVGIYDTLSNKQPQISTTYHKRTVYVVSWGPQPSADEDQKGKGYVVYSVGDGNILVHDPKNLRDEAVVLNSMIYTANPQYNVRKVTRSEISWSPDFTVLAVGNEDGSVELFKYPAFLHVMTIQVHHKLINSIQWHPYVTMATPGGSPCKHWLATGSTESTIAVLDVSRVFDESSQGGDVLRVTESLKTLVGHSSRVTNLAWSPHRDGELASVSYDGNAIVWDALAGTPKACFHGHIGRLLCVQWSGLDPDLVITGGDDFCVHQWRVSENPVQEGQLDGKKKKKKKTKSDFVQGKTETESVTIATNMDSLATKMESLATEDTEELEELLRLKKLELENLEREGVQKDKDVFTKDQLDKTPEKGVPIGKGDTTSGKDKVSESHAQKDRKKRKPKSMFPVTGQMENRGKKFMLDDIVKLAKLIYEPETDSSGKPAPIVLDDDTAHLGLFLTRRTVYACLSIEGQHHRNHDNMEYYYQLEIWKGNINGVLRVARQREELSDWLVAMAPMASFDTWTQVCEDYALQLESDGQYHKAASYLLGCHKVYEAIKLFKRHKLFKEAIALAKVRLSPLDPALEELYTLWAHQLTKDGNYEQAAKCHLAMKQVQDAAKLLARRYDQSSLKTAAHISMIANDKQQGLMYTQKVVQQHLLQNEWKDTYSYLREQKGLQVFMATSSIHEMLSTELTKLALLDIDKTKFTNWKEEKTHKTMLPDFILDREDVDPMSPWQPHLIDGHTFPHHILRVWYSYLDVPMDTASLEDMYKTLCLLHAGRQTQVELQQIIIQVCTDLTLCMISLLMSETPTAMSHLLQAVGSLHEAGHTDIMRGLLQLFLPQGPKYILKIQQEITAMRVMISMDTHSHVDGPSKVHTIKRYLSDLKEEGSVNTSSVRCRELDCLRAYYYMTILHFLKERCHAGEVTLQEEEKKVEKVPLAEREAGNLESRSVGEKTGTSVDVGNNTLQDKSKTKQLQSVIEGVDEESSAVGGETGDKVRFDLDLNSQEAKSDSVEGSSGGATGVQDEGTTVDPFFGGIEQQIEVKTEIEQKNGSGKPSPKLDQKTVKPLPKPDSITKLEDPFGPLIEVQPKLDIVRPKETQHSGTVSQMNMNHFSITITKLVHLSQGLLWDLQAKRYALTETLGYIHKAISQLLLSKKPKPSLVDNTIGAERSVVRPVPEGSDSQTESASSEQGQTDSHTSVANQSIHVPSELSGASGEIGATGTSETHDHHHDHHHDHQDHQHHHLCPHHNHHGHVCQTSLSLHFEHMINIHVPHAGEMSVPEPETEPEFNSSFFEVCASCELIQKSRKILWEDEPHFMSRSEGGGFKDMTNITNPAKYINVPDEWYNMPVDQKYFKPYVTMAILKDEQEYVMSELKRGPDSTQAPFPNPLESVKPLLEVCCHSSHISKVEQQDFVQKVLAWAMNFAVTSQHKQTFVDLLQNQLES